MLATISRANALADLDHLVVVPCHAIWQGGDPSSRLNEEDWILEPYQKGGNRVAAFFNHIERGYVFLGIFVRMRLNLYYSA